MSRRATARAPRPLRRILHATDNDVSGTDVALGFDSALTVATEAVDRLHTTAASHHLVMVLEVMGRNAGWTRSRQGWPVAGTSSWSPRYRFATRGSPPVSSNVGLVLAQNLEGLVPFEVRYVVLGHVQRGGSPTPFYRMLATRFGTAAVAVLVDGKSGSMVALRGAGIERVSLADVLSRPRRVDPEGERVAAARSIGTIFGDETRT